MGMGYIASTEACQGYGTLQCTKKRIKEDWDREE